MEKDQKPSDYTDFVEMLENRVLVRGATQPEVTAGGIIIPDAAKKRADQGVVVAVGAGIEYADTEGNIKHIKVKVGVGDAVLFSKTTGIPITIEGEELILMRDGDCFCILKKKEIKVSAE